MENIFVEFLPPWIETGLQPAFYDKESGTVLQQTARMYARVNMLIRMFNKLSKNTKTTVEDYINQFNELHDYVHDYFDNLDVQEEINNKLDDMTEEGTLQEIITTYIQSNVAWTFDSVAEMQTATNLVDGSYARTLGYYSVNDGGGAFYKIKETAPSGYYETLNSGLYAELIEDGEYNVKHYGVKADGETDNVSILTTILALGIKRMYFPNGEYYIASSVTIPATCRTIEGEDRLETKIACAGDGLIFTDATGIKMRNLTIAKKAPAYQNIGVQGAFQGSFLEDVTVQGFDKGVYVNDNSWSNLYTRCRFIYCNYGYYKTNVGEIDWNDFFKCNFSYNEEAGAYIICNNCNTNFTSCDFEHDKKAVAVGYNPHNLIIDEGYFYGNDIAFSSELGYAGNANVIIQKCWINQPESETYGAGWLATAWCRTAPVQNNKACTITVKECDIYFHELTNKPFAFTNAGTNNASMTVFNILENKYSGNDGVVPNNFPAEYFDLIDTTNFPKYLDIAFRLPVKTDLIYKTLDTHLHWMVSNRGVSNGLGNGSNLFHMFGFYEFTSTGSTSANFSISRTCSPWENYNNRFYGLVRYTDGTIQNSTISIQSEKIYIWGLDTSKTTKEIVLDVWYGGASQLG